MESQITIEPWKCPLNAKYMIKFHSNATLSGIILHKIVVPLQYLTVYRQPKTLILRAFSVDVFKCRERMFDMLS